MHTCTKDDPWTKEKGTPCRHPDAKRVDTFYDTSLLADHYDEFECPNCGLRFKVTLPSH